MGKVGWFIITGTAIMVAYWTYNYVRANGWLDILAGAFIVFSCLMLTIALVAIIGGKK